MKNKILILDTSAVIGGFNPNLEEPKQYIVPKILEEARSLPTKLKLETAISSGQIKVKQPSPTAVEKVEEEVEKTNDRVSDTDIQLLALGQEMKEAGENPEIITDDYAIQNLAELLEIPYSKMAKPGITTFYEWEKECPACGKVYEDDDMEVCEVCGAKLKRKPKD